MTTLFPNERAMVGCKLMSLMLFTYTNTNSCRERIACFLFFVTQTQINSFCLQWMCIGIF